RGFKANGPKVGGIYPKQAASFSDIFALTASSSDTRTYTDVPGIIRAAAYGVTNLLTYSNDQSNAAWTKANATIGAAIAGPTGTIDAYPLIENATSGAHQVN